MFDLIKEIVGWLALVAGAAALILFLLAAGAAVVAAYQVGFRRRPLIVTFGGSGENRAALTTLFARQLMQIESDWLRLAGAVKAAQEEYHEAFDASPKALEVPHGQTPLAEGVDLPTVTADVLRSDSRQGQGISGVGVGPRSFGEETIPELIQLTEENSLSDPDLGTISVAGISFSPQAILALLRRLPAACARQRFSGTLAQFGDTTIIAATYEERVWRRPTDSAHRLVTVDGDWLAAIETLAFRVGKGRLELLRSRRHSSTTGDADEPAQSETAERGFIEADSWEASKAFLAAYERHFKHFVSGSSADRDAAIASYAAAIERQSGYTRAHYNRGTLLYNRYGQSENDLAIEDFDRATKSEDDRLRALAYAGLAMAYGQKMHRFGTDPEEVAAKAKDASEQAIELDRNLEESRFAKAWTLQIEGRSSEAIQAYMDVTELPGESPPGKRIKSFGYNNAAWITMNELEGAKDGRLREAEDLLWKAVALYPNKIAYANLAEVARQRRHYDAAETLFECAVALDRRYVNGWHEYALLELERAARSPKNRGKYLERSLRYEATAERACEDDDRTRIKKAFEKARDAHGLEAATV